MGNNDAKYHNMSPTPDEKDDFYGHLWNLWFKNHPGNHKYATSENEKTFKNGGYYKIQLAEGLNLLSFNTLPYNPKQLPEFKG